MIDAHDLSVDGVSLSFSSLFPLLIGAPSAGVGRLLTGQGVNFSSLPGSSGSYLAAGPVCWAAVPWVGRRGRWILPLWACVAALVACLPVLPVEPPCTVKILPMLREPPPVDPPDVDPPAPAPPPDAMPAPDGVLAGVGSLLGAGPPAGATGPGPGWLAAGTWHALWHSARVMKLLLLPWQPPYQKCMHLEVTTSKW